MSIFFSCTCCLIVQLNMHRVSLQMRRKIHEKENLAKNSWKYKQVCTGGCSAYLAIFATKSTITRKISSKKIFFVKNSQKFKFLVKVWEKGRISDDASRMGKVLMDANLGSQVLTWKVFRKQTDQLVLNQISSRSIKRGKNHFPQRPSWFLCGIDSFLQFCIFQRVSVPVFSCNLWCIQCFKIFTELNVQSILSFSLIDTFSFWIFWGGNWLCKLPNCNYNYFYY